MFVFILFIATIARAGTTFFPNITTIATSQSNPAASTSYSFLVDVCEVSWSNAFLSYMEAAKMEVNPAMTTIIDEGSVIVTSTIPASSFFTGTFSYDAQPSCCGSCRVFGGDFQVFYWPLSPPSQFSTLIDASKFTFISPSIYVGFQSLYATDSCTTLGSTITATAIAFAPGQLSTSLSYIDLKFNDYLMPSLATTFTIAKYGENWKGNCTQITSSFWQVAMFSSIFTNSIDAWSFADTQPTPMAEDVDATTVISGVTWLTGSGYSQLTGSDLVAQYTVTYNPCSPLIFVPPEIYSLESEWNSCVPGIYGFYDPPYVLTTGEGMSAFQTAAAIVPNTGVATTVLAGSVPALALPVQTSSANNDPEPTISVPSDPSAQTPSSDPPQQTLITASPTPIPAVATIGTIVSLSPDGKSLVIGGTTTQILNPATTDEGGIFQYLVGSQKLSAGRPAITVSGTVISLAPGGSSVVVGGVTQALSALLSPNMEYLVGSQTLVAGGPAIMVSGSVISLEAGGASIVVEGTKTEDLSGFLGASMMTVNGLGGIIATIGGFATSIGSSGEGGNGGVNGTVFFSRASRSEGGNGVWITGLLLGIAVTGICAL